MDMTTKEQRGASRGEPPKPLESGEVRSMMKGAPKWTPKGRSMERAFEFATFREAMDFLDRVADVAEREGHHPDMFLYYNKVVLELTTHKLGGLTEKDFHLAAEIDKIVAS